MAVHALRTGKRERAREAAHFDGVSGFGARVPPAAEGTALPIIPLPPSPLLRPLAEYEALAGGAF